MKRFILGLLLIVLSVFSQAAPDVQQATLAEQEQISQGVVVETVAKNSEAEKAGIQEGDVLLSWKRADAKGQIESPFDLSLIEVQQAALGRVELDGLRGAEKRSWTLGPDVWGISARPNFQGTLLNSYLKGQGLSIAGKPAEAAAQWRAASAQTQSLQVLWLGPWLMYKAAQSLANGQLTEADAVYQQALQLAATDSRIRAQVAQAWADSFQTRRNWVEAERNYQNAVAEYRKSGGADLMIALNLTNLGIVAFQNNDLPKAEEYYLQALAIREKLAPGSLPVAKSQNVLGNVYLGRGDLAKAEESFRSSLSIREHLAPGSPDVAVSFYNLGRVVHARGDLSKAEEYHRQALAIREKLAPGGLEVAISLYNLSLVARDRGNLTEAEGYCSQAAAIFEKLDPGSPEFASVLGGLANFAWRRGDLAEAEEHLLRARDIQERRAPGSPSHANSLSNLGVIAWERGDLARAEEYYKQGLSIRQRLAPEGLSVADSLNNLGMAARDGGDLAKAEEYGRRAVAIYEKLAPESVNAGNVIDSLAGVALDRGDLAQAETYERRALVIREKLSPGSLDVAISLSTLADVARERGDLAGAAEGYRRALAIREELVPRSMLRAESMSALALVLRRQQQPEAAVELYAKALDVLESETSRIGGSASSRSSFRAKYARYYKDYIDLLVEQKRPDVAFQVLEQSRARTLLETLAIAHADIRQGISAALLARQRSLQAEIAAKSDRRIHLLSDRQAGDQLTAIDKEIKQLLDQYQDVEEQIRATSPAYAELTHPQPLSVKEIQQQLLDEDTSLLEYSLGEERSYLFVLGAASLTVFELPKRVEIERSARRIYELLTIQKRNVRGKEQPPGPPKNVEAEFSKATAKLSRMVLGPAAAALNKKRLLIVADGALQYVPFAMLPEAAGTAAGQQPPLIVNHEIVNLPSASVLAVLRQQKRGRPLAAKAVAVLADPVFDKHDHRVSGAGGHESVHELQVAGLQTTDRAISSIPPAMDPLTRSAADIGLSHNGQVLLPRLPFSREEAESIVSVTPKGESLLALDFDANRAAAADPQLSQYRIVHFATHGLLDSEHPELSGLVFSLVDKNGKPQEGFLTLQDIYNMNLPAELVVLSACETGLGKDISGEGLVGLTRGFMYAGASRVVASLWKVSDVATARLMAEFYKAMESEGMRPAEALRAAQIRMWKRKRWSSPYYWAGFQLQGEWK